MIHIYLNKLFKFQSTKQSFQIKTKKHLNDKLKSFKIQEIKYQTNLLSLWEGDLSGGGDGKDVLESVDDAVRSRCHCWVSDAQRNTGNISKTWLEVKWLLINCKFYKYSFNNSCFLFYPNCIKIHLSLKAKSSKNLYLIIQHDLSQMENNEFQNSISNNKILPWVNLARRSSSVMSRTAGEKVVPWS